MHRILWQEWQTIGRARLLTLDIIETARTIALLRAYRDLLSGRYDKSRKAMQAGNETLTAAAPDLAALQATTSQLHDLERQQLARRHQLNALLGLAPEVVLTLNSQPDIPPWDPHGIGKVQVTLARRRPDLVALQLGYRAQNAKLRTAILSQFPNLTFGVTGGSDNANVRNFGPQVSLELPIFNHNQGNIAIETATRQQLHDEYTARLTTAVGQVRAMAAEITLLLSQLQGVRRELVGARRIAAQAESAFKAGNIDERTYVDLVGARLTKEQEVVSIEQSELEQQVAIATLVGAGMPAITVSSGGNSMTLRRFTSSTRAGSSFAVSPVLADATPSVAVQTQLPREGRMPDMLTAYGSAAPALDGGMTLSFQQEGRVLAIGVTPGERVSAGMRLLDFGASPAAVSAYAQAVSAVAAARQQRAHMAQLLGQQLATRDQLAQADKALTDAQAALDALKREGADRPDQTLTAPFDGIIATIPVAQGDRVQPGATLMTMTRLDGLVVTVGIDPDARGRVHPGDAVHLTSLSANESLDGKVLRVDGTLNPKTRLVNADVSVPAGSVISGAAFRADITVGQLTGWIVPHDAIMSDNQGAYLFQVAGTTAARVDVRVVGTSAAGDIVQGALDPHRAIVVEGNYQLSDKAAVRLSSSR